MRPTNPLQSILTIAAIGMTCVLAGCAGPMPKADPSLASISLHDAVPDAMFAQQVDGQTVKDNRYFAVPAGQHQLSVMLLHVKYQNKDNSCVASVNYPSFTAGARYHMVEATHGPDISVHLDDAQGHTLATAKDVDCMAS
jgi:hypothetical protein